MTWRRAFYIRVTKTEDLIISRFFGRRVKDELLYNQVLRIIKIAVKSDVKDGRI